MQMQQFQGQMAEIDSALKELESAKESYKIIGNIMVLSEKEDLIKDLKSKKDVLDLRIKTLEKQESQMKEKASAMQSDVLKNMEKKE
jgi:prefoldin beta subunit